MISFQEFIDAYNDGSIEDDITWRGHDIPGSVRKADCSRALKRLGYGHSGEHALPMVRAEYRLDSLEVTRQLLEYWWGLRRASAGNAVRVKRRSVEPGGGPHGQEPPSR